MVGGRRERSPGPAGVYGPLDQATPFLTMNIPLIFAAPRYVELRDAVIFAVVVGILCFAGGLACSRSTYDDGEGN